MSQWRAVAIKFSFYSFLLKNAWFLFVESFNIIGSALHVFGQSRQKIRFFNWKKMFGKIMVFFIFPKQKKSPVFVEKWAKNKCLVVNISFLLHFHCLTYSLQWMAMAWIVWSIFLTIRGCNWAGGGSIKIDRFEREQDDMNIGAVFG